jgi:hypothetical protein
MNTERRALVLEFAPCEGTGSSGPLVSRMSRTQIFHAPSHPRGLHFLSEGSVGVPGGRTTEKR